MLYIGIDQHSKQITVSVREESGNVILRRQVSTRWEKINAFLEEMKGRLEAHGSATAVVEVCGFNHWLLERLKAAGWQTLVVQPERSASHKTDRRDANALSEVLWVNRERVRQGLPVRGLRQIQVPGAQDQDDRRLTSLRHSVGRELTRTVNRIKAILRRHNLEQECPTKGLLTRKGVQWLGGLALCSVERVELDQQLARLHLLRDQLRHLQMEVEQRYEFNPGAQRLATIPGAAAYSALGLVSRVGDVRRFRGPRSLANYWGLTPGCRNSGEATDRLGSITKEGSPLARFLLGQLVMHVLRKDPEMRFWYRRIKRRRGAKIGRVAVMRRLATIVWHMLSKDEDYVVGGPPRRRLQKTEPMPQEDRS
jgi:transposase